MPTAVKPNIHQRLLAIASECNVAKGGTAPAAVGGFAFHKIDDIEAALQPLLTKHGVTALPTVSEAHFEPNGSWHHATVCVDITFTNVDTPEDTVSIAAYGQGFDKQDKAAGKAISYACKNAYLSVFHLKGQPDNESDATEEYTVEPEHTSVNDSVPYDATKVIPHGKNAGTPYSALDAKSLQWYADNTGDINVAKAAEAELDRREADLKDAIPNSGTTEPNSGTDTPDDLPL